MEDDRITGFSVSGHSGYAESGSDIVCAAITAIVTMAEATINDVCGAKAKVRVLKFLLLKQYGQAAPQNEHH